MSTKFTDLTTKTVAAAADIVPINDVSASTDKKTTVGGLAAGVASSFADGAIAANALATSAITLGYSQLTSNVTASGSNQAFSTPLSASVTVPTGGRVLEIEFFCANAGGGANPNFAIWDGSPGIGTQIAQANISSAGFVICKAFVTPAAGAKTYSVGTTTGSGTVTVNAGSTFPAYLVVKAA